MTQTENIHDKPMHSRAFAKTLIIRELSKKDWRPSYVRTIIHGFNDLDKIAEPEEKEVKRLIKACAKVYSITVDDMMSKSKQRVISSAKHLFYWHLLENFGSPSEASSFFGQSHATAIYARKKINGMLGIKAKEMVYRTEKLNEILTKKPEEAELITE